MNWILRRCQYIGIIGIALSSASCQNPLSRKAIKADAPKTTENNQGDASQTTQNKVINVTLTAAPAELSLIPGKMTKVWVYNDQLPGPTIHANVGDVVVVDFHNELPEPSTIHWHGMELPAAMDGSHISQPTVKPGEKFTYRFQVHRAGTYWYHPHFHTNEQVEKGLYGAIIVHDPLEDQELGLPTNEKTVILDDILLDKENQIKAPFPSDPMRRAETQANGREGNFLLANGKIHDTVLLPAGKPYRLRFINAANARFFRLSIPEPSTMVRIGGDTGLLEYPLQIQSVEKIEDPTDPVHYVSNPDPAQGLVLVPGERADVVIYPQGNINELIHLSSHDMKRGRHVSRRLPGGIIDLLPDPNDGKNAPIPMLAFQLTSTTNTTDDEASHKIISRISGPLKSQEFLTWDTPENKEPLVVTFGHSMADKVGNIVFFAKTKMVDGKMQPVPLSKITNATALKAVVGETRMIEIVNLSAGIHPFHIHGFPFQHIETQYIDSEHPDRNYTESAKTKELKDTIAVPGRPGYRMRSKTIMRLLVKFDNHLHASELVAEGGKPTQDQSGGWFVHCHILEHARLGMATWLNLRAD